MMTDNRQAARAKLAKEIAPLLAEFAATYFNDPTRPNFAYSELGLAIKTTMLVLDHYAALLQATGESTSPQQTSASGGIDNSLRAMAADPDIQRENSRIAYEFRNTESDGLEEAK